MTLKRKNPALAGNPGLVETAGNGKFSTGSNSRVAHFGAARRPDLSAALAMLEAVAPAGQVTYQTFDESPAKRQALTSVRHGDLSDHLVEFERLQGQGAGVFVMVNEGDGRGRSKDSVRAVRAVFVDLDGAPLEPVLAAPLAPHLITETSSGRFHAYWRVKDFPLDKFTAMQKALAAKFNSDPAVSDLPRVMRLAGFWHLKGALFQTRIIANNPREPYMVAELCTGLGLDLAAAVRSRAQGPGLIPTGSRNTTLFNMAAGFRNQGLPAEQILTRIQTANKRCAEPLDDAELRTIANNAAAHEPQGCVSIDFAELDSPAYLNASFAARALYIEAKRLHAATKAPVSLTLRDLRHRGFTTQKRLSQWVRELLRTGLLKEVRPARWGRTGEHRQCALYDSGQNDH